MRAQPSPRTRYDRCPGALRPWQAADGLLVRLRLIGGRVTSASLRALLDAAEEYGDGRVRVTVRVNLQVRAFPGRAGTLLPEALAGIEGTGLSATATHPTNGTAGPWPGSTTCWTSLPSGWPAC